MCNTEKNVLYGFGQQQGKRTEFFGLGEHVYKNAAVQEQWQRVADSNPEK